MNARDAQLRGALVTLRPIAEADTEDIVRWRNDPAVRSNFIYRKTLTADDHRRWLAEQVAAGNVVQWIICPHADGTGRGVGSVYLRDIDMENSQAEYGIFIGEEDARGKGYGKEAARLALQHAFDMMGLARVILRVYADNASAIASYERAGFTTCGILKDVEATDGQRADMLLMEALRGDGTT